jgi:hypothetical protein
VAGNDPGADRPGGALMSRVKLVLICVAVSILSLGAVSLHTATADTTYTVYATVKPNYTWSDFNFTFVDKGTDEVYTAGVDVILNFSNVTYMWQDEYGDHWCTWSAINLVPDSPETTYTERERDPSESPDLWVYWFFGTPVAGTDLVNQTGYSSVAWEYERVSAVPLPPSAFMFGAGLIGLAWARRKQRLG